DLIGDQIRQAEDVLKFPLLYSTTRPESWRQWFALAGVADIPTPSHSAGFELQSLVVRAAQAGLGVALVPEFFVPDSAWQSGLVRAHPLSMLAEDAYHLVYPMEMADKPSLQCFRTWILQEAQQFATESAKIDDKNSSYGNF